MWLFFCSEAYPLSYVLLVSQYYLLKILLVLVLPLRLGPWEVRVLSLWAMGLPWAAVHVHGEGDPSRG